MAFSASVIALALLAISGLFGSAAHAQEDPVPDVRTWIDPNGGPSFTFASYGIWQSCSTRGNRLTTTGMRPGWRLIGNVNVRQPLASVPLYTLPVDQSEDLNLLVPFPPVTEWQDNGSNFEIHVDISISVFDENGELVQWVGGGLPEIPGVLGPGQDFDIFCGTPLTPNIDIIKLTNGADANNPDAAGVPVVAVGAPVTWTYLITNTGPVDIPLAEITVTDNIPGVSPLFDAVVSGDSKGDGNGILEPGEVWRYLAGGVAVNLSNPPANQGLVLVPNVCRGGNANIPGRTAYTNIGAVEIPNMSATDPSSYCNPLILLSVSKTAIATHTLTRTWEITKSVTPAVVNLFEGQNANTNYTVQVTPTTSVELFAVSGSISITNTGEAATDVSSVVDTISGGGAGAGVVGVTCPGNLPQSLAVGSTLVCTYTTSLVDASTRTNSVVVTYNGGVSQATAQAQIVFGPPVMINNAVTVDDAYNGGPAVVLLGGITSPTTIPYTRTVACGSELEYENGVATFTRANIARIVETGQNDDATVRVNCYRPVVGKTVNPEYTRRYTWQIQKRATPTQLNLLDGQSSNVAYTVTLTKSAPIDENFSLSGTITVNNPHPSAALLLTGITDRLSNGQSMAVTCPSSSVPAGGALVCTYMAALPNNASGANTATITATTGIVYSSPAVPYTFVGLPPSQTTLGSVTVTDTNPATGQPWAFGQSGTQTYTLPFDCVDVVYNEGGTFEKIVDNTAVITQTGQQSSARVILICNVPTSLPPSEEPAIPYGDNVIFLPAILQH